VPVPDAPGPRPPEELAEAARALGIPAGEAADVEEALAAIARATPGARVLSFGSLYLAGAALRAHEACTGPQAQRA
jgi:dihydrofolate synthase/folylpolyglutamate synthase